MPPSPTPATLAFRNVRAIDPACDLDQTVDVVVSRGCIERVGPNAAAALQPGPEVRVIDGHGRWLLPGLVEVHAHLREPGFEYKEDIASGLAAAAAGGYAHVCAMPNTRPVNDTRAITEFMINRAAAAGGPALHPISAITVGLEGKELVEMADQKDAGAVGVSDDGRCVMSSAVMRHALEYAANFDLVVIQHAEDHTLTAGALMNEGANATRLGLKGWPRAAEEIIFARDIILVETARTRYHMAHVSTRGSVRLLRDAKARGLPVTAEVTPHHLLLDDSLLASYDTTYKVNPPLREADDIVALREALADGTIDCIATDHAPHAKLEKNCEFAEAAHGMIGLQTCLPLMLGLVHDGTMSLTRMIDALTAAPARVVGIPAPTIRQGAVAELCLVDPEARYVFDESMILSKSTNSPFIGRPMRGAVLMTVARGQVVYDRLD